MIISIDLQVYKVNCCCGCQHICYDAATAGLCYLNGLDVCGDLCNHTIDDAFNANTSDPNDSDDLVVGIYRNADLCHVGPNSFSCSYLHAYCTSPFCDNKVSVDEISDSYSNHQIYHLSLDLHHSCYASLSTHYDANSHFSCLCDTTQVDTHYCYLLYCVVSADITIAAATINHLVFSHSCLLPHFVSAFFDIQALKLEQHPQNHVLSLAILTQVSVPSS